MWYSTYSKIGLVILRQLYVLGCFAGYKDINGTVNYSLADNTKEFIQKKANFDFCVFNATGVSGNSNEIFSLINVFSSVWFQLFQLILMLQ